MAILTVAAAAAAGAPETGPQVMLPQLDQVFMGEPTTAGAELGRSVAYREPFLVAGAWSMSSQGMPFHGAARTWRYSPAGWIDEGVLLAQDRAAGDQFGCAVAVARSNELMGTYVAAVVGAEGVEVDGLTDAGAAYVFRRNGGGGATWTQEGRLVASDRQAGARFGRAVAIDGDLIAIGAPQHDGIRGAVYVFRLSLENGAKVWVEEAILTASDAASGDGLGVSVDVVGDVVVAGAFGADRLPVSGCGAVFVFARGESGWSQVAKITAPNGQAQDELGRTVSIDRDGMTIAAGTSTSLPGGLARVHVFERSGQSWTQTAMLLPPSPQFADGFATSISVNEGRVLVGAPTRTVAGLTHHGAAYIYGRGAESVWTLDAELDDDEGATGDAIGSGVVLHGEAAVVGARGVDVPPIPNVGAALIFWVRDCDTDGRLSLCHPLPGDLNVDGFVDGLDLAMVLCNWGPEVEGMPGDANDDGEVDGNDLAILLGQWTGCP